MRYTIGIMLLGSVLWAACVPVVKVASYPKPKRPDAVARIIEEVENGKAIRLNKADSIDTCEYIETLESNPTWK